MFAPLDAECKGDSTKGFARFSLNAGCCSQKVGRLWLESWSWLPLGWRDFRGRCNERSDLDQCRQGNKAILGEARGAAILSASQKDRPPHWLKKIRLDVRYLGRSISCTEL
jgi:hypothetical protein